MQTDLGSGDAAAHAIHRVGPVPHHAPQECPDCEPGPARKNQHLVKRGVKSGPRSTGQLPVKSGPRSTFGQK